MNATTVEVSARQSAEQLGAEFKPHFDAIVSAQKEIGDIRACAWRGKDRNERARKIRASKKAWEKYRHVFSEFQARAETCGVEMFEHTGNFGVSFVAEENGLRYVTEFKGLNSRPNKIL